jgi:hypothetical protein
MHLPHEHVTSVACGASDAELVLDFFGFLGRTVTIQEDDPDYLGKLLGFKRYRATCDAPQIAESIKKAMLTKSTSIENRIFVVDQTRAVMTQFGEDVDLVRRL